MKINLIISSIFPPEPLVSAKLSYDIANEVGSNEPVTVLSPVPSRPLGFNFNATVNAQHFRHVVVKSFVSPKPSITGRFLESYSFGMSCKKFIVTHHSDIKIIYVNAWPLFAQHTIVHTANKYKIPVVVHVQDIYPESLTNKIPVLSAILNYLLLPIDKYVLNKSTKIIAISDSMKRYLVKTRKLNSDRVFVIRNWQDETDFTNYKNSSNPDEKIKKPFVFMYLGNIGATSDVEFLIHSFSKVAQANSKLIIAGSGSQKGRLQKLVSRLKNSDIEFCSVADGKVPEVQSQANVLLLPLKKGASASSIPSKLASYMFSGKPIIACVDEGGDTAACIIESGCGFVVPPGNIEMLSECMRKIINLPTGELKEMGEKGLSFAEQNLSKETNLKKIVSLLISPG